MGKVRQPIVHLRLEVTKQVRFTESRKQRKDGGGGENESGEV